MNQLSIFEIVPSSSSGKLPVAIIPLEPKVEEAIALLEEIAKLRIDSELVVGCTVRSSLFFKGKTATVISFKQIGSITLAIVEIEFKGCLIKFPCSMNDLQVVL
jgi:hypothetical protein